MNKFKTRIIFKLYTTLIGLFGLTIFPIQYSPTLLNKKNPNPTFKKNILSPTQPINSRKTYIYSG